MRISGAILAAASLAFAVTACSGGGGAGVPHVVAANPKPSPTPSTSGATTRASVSFTIVLPPTTRSSQIKPHRKPLYVGATTQGVIITVANPGGTFAPITASNKQCSASGVCTLTATASLPILPQPYTFTVTAYGNGGTADVLSEGTSAPTVLSSGNTNIALTLAAVVASVSLAVAGQPSLSGTATQTLPVTFSAFDPDGNLITGSATQFAQSFQIGYDEIDPFGAFNLSPGPSGSATCMLSSQTCSLVSNGDTLNVTFNPTATDFAADASYYPYEFDLYDYTATTFTASNSLAITTPPCVTPNPICVYSPPALQELVANGGTFSHSVVGVFNPTFVSVSGATIWTDLGVISATAPAPTYALYSSSVVSNQSIAALEVPGGTTVFAPDYSGASPQLLDDISPTGTLSTSTYPPDTNTLNGAPSGAGIILGPDGNLWWIDPVTGVLRYANPSSPSVVTSCLLQPPGTNVFLTAAQIVPTPSGVSPSRIWFSAVDNFGGSPGFTYLGYVNVPASGSNSCGSGQTGQYAAFDKADYGTPVPPNGLAVDGSGNAWYNDGDIYINSANATAIGEATVGSTGAVTVAKSVLLPGQNTPGDLGYAGQAWGLVYDPLDGNLYFATDNGLIGRFNPTLGLSSVAAYALPSMLANLQDSSSGPSYNDAECFAVPGPCNPQLVWDPGTSSKGRLTFTTLTSLSEPYYTTTTAQLDLGSAAVGFSSEARSHQTTRTKRPHHRIFRTYGRRRTAG